MRTPGKISVYGNTSQGARLAEIGLFLRHLAATQIAVEIWSSFEQYLANHGFGSGLKSVDEPSADSELVLTLGGDGTLLQGLRWCGNRRIALLGVNTGHLGFLTAYPLTESHLLLADLRYGRLVGEPRMLLEIRAKGDVCLPADVWPYALNEVALLKAESSSMITVRARVDGHYLTHYWADGLIISTPTGSTGYNLSAGGPIMAPTLDNLLLTPIAAHTLSVRPVVVSADSLIGVHTEGRDGSYRVSLDGRSFTMASGTELEVLRAAEPAVLLRRTDEDFAATLRSKLHWGNG